MEALTLKAALVDPATLGKETAVTTAIARSEIEGALREADGPTDLFLETKRSRDGEEEAQRRITLSWEPDDLERLLATSLDPVTLAFRADELNRMLEEPDVEAQGLREKAAILSVAAVTAAGIGTGAANAMVAEGYGGPGSAPVAAQRSAPDATSSGLDSAAARTLEQPGGARFSTDTPRGVSAARPTEAKPAGGGEDFLATSGGAATLAGGITLLIAAAGFTATRHRTRARPA